MVSRHLFKVLVGHTLLKAKLIVTGAPTGSGVEAYSLPTRHSESFTSDVASQMLEDIIIVVRATPKDIDQLVSVPRGLHHRMHNSEALVGELGDVRTVDWPPMVMITAVPATKAHFRKENVIWDLDGMKREVEAIGDLHKLTRSTVPLQLKTCAEQRWQEPCCDPEGYTQDE